MKKEFLVAIVTVLTIPIILSGCSMVLNSSAKNTNFSTQLALKAPEPATGESPKILFVGNSHTFYNDLPGTFYEFTSAMGHEADVYELTEGYYKLKNFADTNDELGSVLDQILTEEQWDFVILQENTTAAFSSSPDKHMFPFARTLDEKIKNAGGQTAFLMTWSPKNGLGIGNFKLGREKVQKKISENYIKIANELDALLLPAGVAFMRCTEKYPDIELWDEDEQHPSPEGTYLATCIAYTVFYQSSPVGCPFIGDLNTDTATKLQQTAEDFLSDK